jgi:hypothetical protein
MRYHITTHLLKGIPTNFIDVGCDDFDRAESNRAIIKNKLFIEAWVRYESALAHTPANRPLPDWVPCERLYLEIANG